MLHLPSEGIYWNNYKTCGKYKWFTWLCLVILHLVLISSLPPLSHPAVRFTHRDYAHMHYFHEYQGQVKRATCSWACWEIKSLQEHLSLPWGLCLPSGLAWNTYKQKHFREILTCSRNHIVSLCRSNTHLHLTPPAIRLHHLQSVQRACKHPVGQGWK